MSFICIIPARKNSKRIKNKNLLKIKGKTILSIAITAAKKSRYINNKNIFVSTDCKIIKKEAELHGAYVPFLRPKFLGKDSTKMHSVLNHFVSKVSSFVNFKYVILLQPTSPFRTHKHINEACELFLANNNRINKLISVRKLCTEFSPFKIMVENNRTISQLTGYKNYHNKKINFFLRNGPAIFIYTNKKLKNNIYEGESLKYIMSEKESLDLNEYSDLKKIKKN
jgi:CMP-N,N'-diacetyllegionaminic acid synthase